MNKLLKRIGGICLFFCVDMGDLMADSTAQVFQLSNISFSNQTLHLHWTMAHGAYLYKQFIKVVSVDPEKIQVGTPFFPEGETKNTHLFGKVTVYHDALLVNVPIENPDHQLATQLKLSYQGCSDEGQCFPPMTKILNLDFLTQMVSE